MKSHFKRYDDDFKRMLVDLYNTTNPTFQNLENKYGMTTTTIQRFYSIIYEA